MPPVPISPVAPGFAPGRAEIHRIKAGNLSGSPTIHHVGRVVNSRPRGPDPLTALTTVAPYLALQISDFVEFVGVVEFLLCETATEFPLSSGDLHRTR